MSDWFSKMPMGWLKVTVGRWKSAGGGTCLCVAEPGRAQSGTSGDCVEDEAGACANASAEAKGRVARFATEKAQQCYLHKDCRKIGVGDDDARLCGVLLHAEDMGHMHGAPSCCG